MQPRLRSIWRSLLSGVLTTALGAQSAPPPPAANEALPPNLQARLDWWSFRPLSAAVPTSDAADSAAGVDHFLDAAMASQQLTAAPRADAAALLRRLSFALRGLPPRAEELDAWLRDPSDAAWRQRVDTWLDTPDFAETWARHWMDWLRYADSHGSEGDAPIPYAYRYRDYLIRALQQDVGYDQLVREHIAGDLLPHPRIDSDTQTNESALGTAQLRMVFHGYAPTDALAERIRFTDDQIDVLSKAFLGLTVSCARCHDHKFDPISQRDYTALQGVFFSSSPAIVDVQATDPKTEPARLQLAKNQQALRRTLASCYETAAAALRSRLAAPDAELSAAIARAKTPDAVLYPFAQVQAAAADPLAAWRARADNAATATPKVHWRMQEGAAPPGCCRSGPGVQQAAPAGALALATDGVHALRDIYPSGTYSHLAHAQDRGVLQTPRVRLDAPLDLWLLVCGDGGAAVRPVVQDYPRDGSVFPITRLSGGHWQWVRFALDYWTGDEIHVELATAADQPVLANLDATSSWFGVRDVLLLPHGASAPSAPTDVQRCVMAACGERKPTTASELAEVYTAALTHAAAAWGRGEATDQDAALLSALLREDLLPNRAEALPEPVRLLLRSCEILGRQLALPIRAPGVLEHDPRDASLLVRGDARQPTATVPRRSLSLLGGTPCSGTGSGRLDLAMDWTRRDNPLLARVAVNRVWQVLFGRGLVDTPDNFGRLGAQPSHPQLLDWLAQDFAAHGWSLKHLIRQIVTSAAFQRATPTRAQRDQDADNRWLAFGPMRRLNAEAVRDTLLWLAADLDRTTVGGPSVDGSAHRRSLYVRQQRNAMDPFLAAFDAPVPASCQGNRNVTNVPAQALTLLNDPFVWTCAEHWATSLGALTANDPNAAMDAMYLAAFSRRPTAAERARSREFVETEEAAIAGVQREREAMQRERMRLQEVRAGLAQKLALALRPTAPSLPVPVYRFSQFALPVTAQASALELDGQTRCELYPLPQSLSSKTLIVTLQLDNLEQRGGGAIAVEDNQGNVFDAIVYGEREPGRWQAGSDRFARTQSFDGPAETEAHTRRVHVAITWDADGTITCYRDGERYGHPYRATPPVAFAANSSWVALGVRHVDPQRATAPNADRLLRGRIFDAWVFDRTLSLAEVQSHALLHAAVASPELRRSAPPVIVTAWEDLIAAEARLRDQAAQQLATKGPSTGWASLAHALLNHKEFVWLR